MRNRKFRANINSAYSGRFSVKYKSLRLGVPYKGFLGNIKD